MFLSGNPSAEVDPIKFTDAGEIQIEAAAVNEGLVVSVSDTGPGISEADRENIFEEFRQAEGSIARRRKAASGWD